MCKCSVSATYNSTKLAEGKMYLGALEKEGGLAENEREGMFVWRGQPGWGLCKKQSFTYK